MVRGEIAIDFASTIQFSNRSVTAECTTRSVKVNRSPNGSIISSNSLSKLSICHRRAAKIPDQLSVAVIFPFLEQSAKKLPQKGQKFGVYMVRTQFEGHFGVPMVNVSRVEDTFKRRLPYRCGGRHL